MRVALAILTAGLIAVLVVAGLVIAAQLGDSTTSSSTFSAQPSNASSNLGVTSESITTSASPTPCTSSIPADPLLDSGNQSGTAIQHELSNGTIRMLVLTLSPGGTGYACVQYSLVGSGNLTVSAKDFAVAAYSVNATAQHPGSGFVYYYTPAPGVTVTSNVSAAMNLNEMNSITVLYTVDSSAASSGFFDLAIPNDCPPLLPFAVTGSPQSANGSDFVGFFMPSTCPITPPLGSPTISGFSGFSAEWISE